MSQAHRTILILGAAALMGAPACGPLDGEGAEPVDPGRITWHRLNVHEYNHTVRDLLGTRLRPADDFPADDLGYGFDNIAQVLSLSPLHLELYERAATELAVDALRMPIIEPLTVTVEGEVADVSTGIAYQGWAWALWEQGTLEGEVSVPMDGRYRLDAHVFGQQAGEAPVRMQLWVDGAPVAEVDVTATAAPEVHGVEVDLTVGNHRVGVSFENPYFDLSSAADRQLIVDRLSVVGPLDAPPLEDWPRTRLMVCDPAELGEEACAREVLTRFASRAFRRPIRGEELDGLMALYQLPRDEGLGFDDGLELAVRAVLLSPHFIFRVELDPEPGSDTAYPLDVWALASRLSYFLWSSMPDDALFEAAETGALLGDDEIARQVARMLEDPKAEALVQGLFDQWFYIRDVANVFPDPWVFPDFDEALREAMAEEMRRFAATFLFEDRSVTELLTASETFVNDRLAAHYGLPPVGTDDFVRVSLDDAPRRGLLTQAGLLTVLSTPFRTSIVRRGQWVLEQLMCSPPPPPPPGVEGLLAAEDGAEQGASLRELLEVHREDPVCAGCHSLMDPIGFGLDHYDGIGAWRDEDDGYAIDATGYLVTGETFDGALELAEILAEDARFLDCVVEKVFTYALGRGPTAADAPTLSALVEGFEVDGLRLPALFEAVARSAPFRERTGEPEEAP